MSISSVQHPVSAGARDVTAAAQTLAARLPAPIADLAHIAYNYRWSWTAGAEECFARVDGTRWALCSYNPVRLLHEAPRPRFDALAADPEFVATVQTLSDELASDLSRPAAQGAVSPEHPAAFLCAEFAVHQSLPVYSGGLGVLAGDILKAASDLALALVGVGIMYRHGYFRQRTDINGYQHEYWVDTDPDMLPAALVTGADGHPLTVVVAIAERELLCQCWRVDVGRVALFLLDSNRPENAPSDRFITSRLYVGDPDIRVDQYVVLGVGGVRVLEALGIDPQVVHLNEGHAAFAALELARLARARNGVSADQALDTARRQVVFTTHTPVAAGNDTYPSGQICQLLAPLAAALGVDPAELVARGRTRPQDASEPFGVTQFALRTSRSANAVAARHGQVAREMWRGIWPELDTDAVPITSVTNGVHLPTWLGAPMRAVLDRYLPAGWLERHSDPHVWDAVYAIPDGELWAAREQQRAAVVKLAAERSVMERLSRGEGKEYAHAAQERLRPDALTVGFARRMATYKRLDLLLADLDEMLALLSDERRPLQLLVAGKAHPRDEPGKALIKRLFEHGHLPPVAGRVVFLDDYDMRLGAAMTRGCDVWLNLPRPPLEASGTSGMKSALNGGLQLSVLDGWWPEAYDGTNGWAISGEVDSDEGAQDTRHARELRALLVNRVLPAFYEREAGLPSRWLALMRRSLVTCAPRFSAQRMVAEYAQRIYPQRMVAEYAQRIYPA
ncbi:MAG: alpha-glucan family phosphorylase [Solirubrobacteraceae bacterium]